MHSESVKHTIYIFELLCRDIPPLVPPQIAKDMRSALEQMKLDADLTLEQVERTMVVYGKQVWSYRQAYNEIFAQHEGRLGEKFFVQSVGAKLKRRYEEFKAHGGAFADLHTGTGLEFFSHDERILLCEAIIGVRDSLRSHVNQAVLSRDQKIYEEKILEFQVVLDDIEKRLETLRLLADAEQEHMDVADEIREQIKAFEYGLCALGPATSHAAVCEAHNNFHERKQVKRDYTFA